MARIPALQFSVVAVGLSLLHSSNAFSCGRERFANRPSGGAKSMGSQTTSKLISSKGFELKLAEVFERELEQSSQKSGVVYSRVLVPVRMRDSDFHPYGDGQSNSTVDYGDHWNSTEPPLVVVYEMLSDRSVRRLVKFAASLAVEKYVSEMRILGGQTGLWIQPQGWRDAFWIPDDQTEVFGWESFREGLPQVLRQRVSTAPLPDPSSIRIKAKVQLQSSFEHLLAQGPGAGYNSSPYLVDDLHGRYPLNNDYLMTATGRGWTWVRRKDSTIPFDHLYSCFEGRDKHRELALGVPTGAGWHLIGDPAETIVNSLEDGKLVVALAQRNPMQNLAYGLSHVSYAEYLRPGEVFVAKQGQHHWYIQAQVERPARRCVEIWVHPCVPSLNNHWGFSCTQSYDKD